MKLSKKNSMRVGIDLDNTIACYDGLFYRCALEKKLIPKSVNPDKESVRQYFIQQDQEKEWTKLQGIVYGPGMHAAAVYPGVCEWIGFCLDQKIPISIISHRTRHPILGHRYDLHATAKKWLYQHVLSGFLSLGKNVSVYLETDKKHKASRIQKCGITHFVDDLPEFLADPAFPKNVFRILFDPNHRFVRDHRFYRAASWSQVHERLESDWAKSRVFGATEAKRVISGANNRVYQVASDKAQGVLKVYFRQKLDKRDRFRQEFLFLKHCQKNHLLSVPKLIDLDHQKRIMLMEFIPGRAIEKDGLSESDVIQAIDFLRALNAPRRRATRATLPLGSEAYFSIQDHVSGVDQRFQKWVRWSQKKQVLPDVEVFLRDRLIPEWTSLKNRIEADAKRHPKLYVDRLSKAHRIVSPSDFGFHNAIRKSDGSIAFIDFEYAGWDDPARTLCDFLCQPKIPIPKKFWPKLCQRFLELFGSDTQLMLRAQVLWPVYQLKWALILLNHFAPEGQSRRIFAMGQDAWGKASQSQLVKAQQCLRNFGSVQLEVLHGVC